MITYIGNGFYEYASKGHVGVGASEKEAYLNWYNSLNDVTLM